MQPCMMKQPTTHRHTHRHIPTPSWPSEAAPHAKTTPSSLRTSVCAIPHVTSLILCSCSAVCRQDNVSDRGVCVGGVRRAVPCVRVRAHARVCVSASPTCMFPYITRARTHTHTHTHKHTHTRIHMQTHWQQHRSGTQDHARTHTNENTPEIERGIRHPAASPSPSCGTTNEKSRRNPPEIKTLRILSTINPQNTISPPLLPSSLARARTLSLPSILHLPRARPPARPHARTHARSVPRSVSPALILTFSAILRYPLKPATQTYLAAAALAPAEDGPLLRHNRRVVISA
jgi:hypothetical protein